MVGTSAAWPAVARRIQPLPGKTGLGERAAYRTYQAGGPVDGHLVLPFIRIKTKTGAVLDLYSTLIDNMPFTKSQLDEIVDKVSSTTVRWR